jgi:serine/threonine protein kinase
MTTGPRCEKCGAAVEPGALFCSKCGIDVSGTLPAQDATVEMSAAGPPASPVRATMRQTLRDATLGEYEILNELGRGGMATVFLAHDIALDRKVAIKVMAPHLLEGQGMAERFKLEARTAAQLSHPHIIPIYSVRETEETLYFIMKYIEGRGLDEIIKKMAPLPIPMVRDILTKVGAALGYAHRRDVVHRDVKPGNIMIDEEGTPIVTDFGIAKVAETQGLTMTGATIGTPAYMSPEQCEAKEVTGASDQYSLGIVVFEMLTGKVPFQGDTAVSTMYKHCHEPLPPLEDFRPDCPSELRDTVTRMLAKSPSDRWPSLESAIKRLGTSTDPQLDTVRSQLLELARDGDPELLAHLSTPGTPLPRVTTGPRAAAATTGGAATTVPGEGPSRSRLVAAVAGVAIVAAGTLAVAQPWRSAGAELADGPNGAVESPAGGGQAPTGATGGGDPAGNGGLSEGGGPGVDGAAGADPTGADPTGAGGDVSPTGGGAQPSGGQPAGGAVTTPPTETQPIRVASVRIVGAPATLAVGDQVTLGATAQNLAGGTLQRGSPQWSVSETTVARVSPDGTLTALAEGTVEVAATVDGTTGRALLEVVPAPVASVVIEPSEVVLEVGAQARMAARALDRGGETLSGRSVRWTSGDTSVLTAEASGQLSAVGAGTTTLTAEVDGVRASVPVTVTVDVQTAIEDLLAEYERALESRDIARVRQMNPAVTGALASSLEETFRFANDLDVRISLLSWTENAGVITAQVQNAWTIEDRRAGRQDFTDTQTATFRRIPTGLEIVGIR